MVTDKELEIILKWTEHMITLGEAQEHIRRMKMSVKYACILLKDGQVPPLEIMKVICEEFTSGYGLAISEDNNIELLRETGKANAEGLMGYLEQYKEHGRLVWLAQSSNALLEDDLQPYILIEAEEKPQFVCCLTGNFTEYETAGSSHTNEHHAVDKRIRPKSLKLWRGNNSNMAEFDKDIEDGDLVEEMASLCPENSSIIYLTAGGVRFAENKPEDREKEYPWGWAYYGTISEDKPATPPKATGAKLQSLRASPPPADKPKEPDTSALSTGKATSTDSLVSHKKDVDKLILVTKKDSDEFISTPDDAVLTCPANSVDTKERLHAYYNEQIGYVPRNWKARPWFIPKNQSTIKLQNLKDSTADVGKNIDNKYIPAPKVAHSNIMKDFKANKWPEIKLLGHNSEFIADPQKIMNDETKDKSAAAMMDDPNIVTINDLNLLHAGRARLLSLCSGPNAEQYIAFASAWMRDNMNGRIAAENRNKEQQNRIDHLEAELERFQRAAPDAGASNKETSGGTPTGGSGTKLKSLKVK